MHFLNIITFVGLVAAIFAAPIDNPAEAHSSLYYFICPDVDV